jgi:hypothetical protein
MWNESATRAIELEMYPTVISTTKNDPVKASIDRRRHVLPEYLPMVRASSHYLK